MIIVDDLKKVHGEKITFANISVSTPEGKKAVADSKLKAHGIIATGIDGKIIKTVEGHSYGKEKVEKVVKMLLEPKKKKA